MRRVSISRNESPAAAAAVGRSDVGVRPGIVFTSRKMKSLLSVRMKSLRDIDPRSRSAWMESAASWISSVRAVPRGAGTILSEAPLVYLDSKSK